MLDFIFEHSTFLAILGCLLVAFDITKTEKKPWRILAGLGLVGASLMLRLLEPAGLLSSVGGAFSDVALGFWVAAGFLAVKRSKAQPFFVLGLLAFALAASFFVLSRFFDAALPTTNTSILVELGPDDSIEELHPILSSLDLEVEQAFPTVTLSRDEDLAQVYMVTGSEKALQQILPLLQADTENVDHVAWNEAVGLIEPVSSVEVERDPRRPIVADDPMITSQWALDAINGAEAHQMLKDLNAPARKAVVAILDTGVDSRHEDLSGIFQKSPGHSDEHGHGTHCAGIAGAATNNGIGMASLNWNGHFVEIRGYKALGDDGLGSLESIAQAIIDATDAGADVISMSLGGFAFTPPKVVADAVSYAFEENAIVIAAAGNSNQDAKNHMPSNIEGVIVVSAVDQKNRKASFSNTNTSLNRPIAAPGVDILSLKPNNEYKNNSGTSMATPVVSGLVGVMRAINPALTAQEAYAILHQTGTRGPDARKVGRTVNAEAALLQLADHAVQ